MAITAIFFAAFFYQLNSFTEGQFYGQPEQIHLSFGVNPTVMVVTWSTISKTNTSYVDYGQVNYQTFQQRMVADQKSFLNLGTAKRYEYIHRAWMTGLKPGVRYRYRVGSIDGWSAIYTFNAQRNEDEYSPRFAVYGDLGNVNPQSLPRLQIEAEKGMYDAILHVGDMAYDLFENDGKKGDEFMNQIQPIASTIPYMTCPGNHENSGNFSNYRARFTMPTDEYGDRQYYSFDIGPVHLVSISTEHMFYWKEYGWERYLYLYAWLEKDLQKANLPENRSKRPWIITIGHRPMYCSNADRDDCTNHESLIRTGLPIVHKLGLEELFFNYGVDLQIWGHEHSYERLWPVYNRTVHNGTLNEPYTDPPVPVHIITGSAGCYSKHDPFGKDKPAWSAFRSTDYGYSRMMVKNSTHLYWEQVSDDKGGEVIDSFTYIRNKHGPFK